MPITISERLHPYSHVPGASCLVPGSFYCVQVFPTLIRLYRLDQSTPRLVKEVFLSVCGPLKNFTIQSHLEKGNIGVWGQTAQGFIRYRIASHSEGKGVAIGFDNVPLNGVVLKYEGGEAFAQVKQLIDLMSFRKVVEAPFRPSSPERLSLGNHKAQDWELVRRRLNLTEIFPAWYCLGQLLPTLQASRWPEGGTYALLQACREKMNQRKLDEVVPLWTQFFQASFHSLLIPRLQDEDYQGILPSPTDLPDDFSPLTLLTEGASLMRKLFIEQQGRQLSILSLLPPEFPCGRLVGARLEGGGVLDLEWTKKTIRCLSLFVPVEQEMVFRFNKIDRYRLRKGKQEPAYWINSGERLSLEKNCYYFFDNFR